MITLQFNITWNDILDLTWEKLLMYIIIACCGILVYVFKNSTPAYLKKKGENLAQKQDIEELTDIVKKVEQKFNKQNEMLKYEFDVIKQLKIGLLAEERSCIIELHSTIYNYHRMLYDVTLSNVDFADNISISNYKTSVDTYWHTLTAIHLKSDLFIENKKLRIQISEMVVLLLDKGPMPLDNYLQECMIANTSLSKNEISLEKYRTEINVLRKDFMLHVSDFLDATNKDLTSLSNDLRDYLRGKTKPAL